MILVFTADSHTIVQDRVPETTNILAANEHGVFQRLKLGDDVVWLAVRVRRALTKSVRCASLLVLPIGGTPYVGIYNIQTTTEASL